MIHTLHDALFNRSTAAAAGIATFILAVVTGLHYVSRAFATTQPGAPNWLHFASAAAVEVGVLFIGLTLAIRSAEGDRNLRLYAGVALFVGVSMVANYDAAASAILGGPLTWDALQQLDRWTLVKVGALGGVVPLMVLMSLEALRELAQSGAHAPSRSKRSDKSKRGGRGGGSPERLHGMPEVEREVSPAPARNGAASHATAAKPKRKRRGRKGSPERMAELVENDPTLKAAELARMLGVSRPTVYSWADRLGFERDGVGGEWQPA